MPVGESLTELYGYEKHTVIPFFSEKQNPTEQNCTTSEKDLLRLTYFLPRFRWHLEGSNFEVFTDNQVLKSFLTEQELIGREERWLETLGKFGMFLMNLKSGKMHILGDFSSKAPHVL